MTDIGARSEDFVGGRGRSAPSPAGVPRRGWREIALRTQRELKKDRVASVAAGVAFFGMLAVFPALIAAISLYGLVANPGDVERQISAVSGALPGPAQAVLGERLNALVSQPAAQLSFGLVLSIAVALWTASSGTKAMIEAVNLAYDEPERRGFFRLRGLALLMAVSLIVAGILAVLVVTLLPTAFGWFGLGEQGKQLIAIARWPALGLGALIGLAALYHFAPNRARPRWKWVSPGALVATALWIGASLLLSLYVSNFGNYDATYGALAGVVVLMLWMYVSTLVILVGAEINSEIEAQTAQDTVVPPEQPMGRRGAVADRLGQSWD
jgi:membrane protein